jgi:hypothetical protein
VAAAVKERVNWRHTARLSFDVHRSDEDTAGSRLQTRSLQLRYANTGAVVRIRAGEQEPLKHPFADLRPEVVLTYPQRVAYVDRGRRDQLGASGCASG